MRVLPFGNLNQLLLNGELMLQKVPESLKVHFQVNFFTLFLYLFKARKKDPLKIAKCLKLYEYSCTQSVYGQYDFIST